MSKLNLLFYGLFIITAIHAHVYLNQWHVKLNPAEKDQDPTAIAMDVARSLGFRPQVGPPFLNKNEFFFVHHGVPNVHKMPSEEYTRRLISHPAVQTATQMIALKRRKRGYRPLDEESLTRVKLPKPRRLSEEEKQIAERLTQTDPLFSKEWFLHNTGQNYGIPGLDLNVLSAWAQNVTGRGIITAIMDDGIDYLHPDLAPNYSAEASYDFSSNDAFPYPRYTDDWFNSHGTRCAGEISAVAGNHICGVGVAPNSKVAGLRMLDQPYMTDMIEAAAMSHARDLVDIYSASWGPTDDGQTVDGPRNQTMRAIVEGVNSGRGGKGSIYVWASGDGGINDDCNCDGYAASMWTISINSVTNDGDTAVYDESCSSTLASSFSNGKRTRQRDVGVATTDLYGECTLHHSGTSAAAPEAAGVFALALEAQPNLTWRDMQHLTVLTSKRNRLYDPEHLHNWTINGAGLEFNHLFGFGVLDAGAMVRMAKQWKTVPERFHCMAGSFQGRKTLNLFEPLQLEINTNACKGDQKNEVNYVEHVQAFLTIKATRRGDLTIFITSPMNTTSMLLRRRPKDADSVLGFTKWPFMTTHTWGENPRGLWRLNVMLDPRSKDALGYATVTEWILVIHGTRAPPYGGISESLESIAPKLGIVKRQHATNRFEK